MLEPLHPSQWNTATAAHLLNRAGFGGSPADVENFRQMGLEGAIRWLVDYEKAPDDTPAPEWAQNFPDNYYTRLDALDRAGDLNTRRVADQQELFQIRKEIIDLRYWWVRRMALGPRPFQEKMTLFWHGHFTTSFEKVRMPYFLWQQNEMLRQNATGNFPLLLIAVAEDPAMLQYLDGAQSNKNKPNENFAREVMELFTLGEGHYTEHDIREAARAFTGWGLSPNRLHYQYHLNNHDPGPKTVFGQTGNFSGEEVLQIICSQPQCATFIVSKIWRFFVQDEPPPDLIAALAAYFIARGMEIRSLMKIIFRSEEFYASNVIRSQIKSPAQWIIAASHQLEAPLPTEPMTLVMLLQLGQELFQPPNVKGWDGGIAWITTNSLLDRYNYAAAMVEGERIRLPSLMGQMQGIVSNTQEDGLLRIAPAEVMNLFTASDLSTADNFLAALQARFLNGSLNPVRLASLEEFLKTRFPLQEADIRKSIRLLMSTPEYQLT